MVKDPPSNAGDAGLIPGWGTKIPCATGATREACALQQKSTCPVTKTQHSQKKKNKQTSR